jgi:hypothetical protein
MDLRKYHKQYAVGVESTVMDYTLNINRALKKKLKATQRNRTLQYKYTGGGIVITADAASFELFKMAAIAYYEKPSPDGTPAHIQTNVDGTGRAVVQYTIKIRKPTSAPYTINIYTTQSRILVNGEGCDTFVQTDIPNIQSIIVREAKNINLDVELLNQQLQEQLRQLVNGTPTKCNSADIQCPKCGKSCRTRSTYCTTGNHWVHYKCQKLTPVEIRQIEDTDDTESDYTCKICGTDPKQIADGTNSEETLAKSLLLEENETRADEAIQSEEQEQQQQCIKFDKTMKRIESDICIVCDNQCHIHCMEYINGEPTCYTCKAMGIQEEQTSCKTIFTTESTKPHEQLPYQNIAQQTIRKDSTAQQKQVPSQTSIRTDENAVANKYDDTDSTANHREVKYKELRAKETKLKKMEELIKQKEKAAQEVNNNRTKLESRCQELESRNYELEQTVKTLMKRIESLELTNIHDNRSETNKGNSGAKNDANFSCNNDSMADYFNHRFMRMHQKLTDVVFDNIEKHIDRMVSGEITISNQNSNREEQTQGQNNEVKPCSQTEPDSSGRMYNDNVATSKDNEAYVAGQPLFYGKPNPQAAKVTASQPIQHTITRTPPDQYVLSPPLHPGQTTRIVPREKQSGNRYTPLNPRTATSVPFLVNSNPLRMNRHQY